MPFSQRKLFIDQGWWFSPVAEDLSVQWLFIVSSSYLHDAKNPFPINIKSETPGAEVGDVTFHSPYQQLSDVPSLRSPISRNHGSRAPKRRSTKGCRSLKSSSHPRQGQTVKGNRIPSRKSLKKVGDWVGRVYDWLVGWMIAWSMKWSVGCLTDWC